MSDEITSERSDFFSQKDLLHDSLQRTVLIKM